MSSRNRQSLRRLAVILAAVACLATAAELLRSPLTRYSNDGTQLVVYCAHDAVFAESVIRRFESETGISVDVRFDEEANKSLGLTSLLLAEKDHPRCDVFWNNQTLGTIRLQQAGVLATYKGAGHERVPAAYRDPAGCWTGFAARMRVVIVNTDRIDVGSKNSLAAARGADLIGGDSVPEALRQADDLIREHLQAGSLDRVAIAQPMFGTTLTHYSVLAAEWGIDKLKSWHHSLHSRGIREARGNAAVRDLVAAGICDLGFTDTDDAFSAIDSGQPVTMLPVRLDDGRTIVMPNSVAMIKGCPHPEAAARFIEFLLSEATELALANSPARQIPLGKVDESRLPAEVRSLRKWAAEGVSLKAAAEVNQAVLDWLTSEYTPR
ncbi:MAG: substrate-binding domain-containing protein [Planctomycetaceae bacterium]